MKIALVIGHRGGSRGARTVNGIFEYDMWFTYLHTIISTLPTQHEYKIFERYDNDGNKYSTRIRKLVNRVNEWEADIAMSFHFNASDNKNAEGFEVLTTNYWKSKSYANTLLNIFDVNLFGDNRGNKIISSGGRGYHFLRPTHMPSMIIEPFFGSSESDCKNFFFDIGNFTDSLKVFLEQLR